MSLGICRPYESERQSARVLIVDADRNATSELAGLLAELGCDVSYALDARLALLYSKRCKPHVVFVDIKTPHVNPVDLARDLRSETTLANCAVIALCASTDDEPPGLDGVLVKPVTFHELRAVVRPFLPLSDDPEVTPVPTIAD